MVVTPLDLDLGPSTMTFPIKAEAIVRALYTGVNPQDDEARRIAIQRVGEQLAFSLGPRWGNKKRAGLSDAFRSPDSIAYQEDDDTISVWDIQASSGLILVHEGKEADYPHLSPSEATFMVCAPVNHLGLSESVPAPGPTPPNPGTPKIGARLKAIETELQLIRISLAKLHEKLVDCPNFPNYTGRIFGYGVTLRPTDDE